MNFVHCKLCLSATSLAVSLQKCRLLQWKTAASRYMAIKSSYIKFILKTNKKTRKQTPGYPCIPRNPWAVTSSVCDTFRNGRCLFLFCFFSFAFYWFLVSFCVHIYNMDPPPKKNKIEWLITNQQLFVDIQRTCSSTNWISSNLHCRLPVCYFSYTFYDTGYCTFS